MDRLVRRLRSLSESAWRSRREPVTVLLENLASLTGRLERIPAPVAPDLPVYALPDAVVLLGGDVLIALSRTPDLADLDLVDRWFREAFEETG